MTTAGLVVVHALVDRDGAVIDVGIARSVPALDAAALRAVGRWHFRPAKRDGRAVPVSVYVPVRFAPTVATSRHAAQPMSSADPQVDSFELVRVDSLNDSIAAGARAGKRWTKDPVRVALEILGMDAQGSRSLDLHYHGDRGEFPDSADVTLVIDGYADDSVRGSWVWLRLARGGDDTWRLVEFRRAWRCWRGHHQGSYSNRPCL